jgi:hypothetical protein
VTLQGETSWDCVPPDGTVAQNKHGALDTRSDEVRAGTAAGGTPVLRPGTFTRDPFDGNPLRLVCAATDDASPLTMTLTPMAANGKGMSTVAPGIVITYLGRPAGPP